MMAKLDGVIKCDTLQSNIVPLPQTTQADSQVQHQLTPEQRKTDSEIVAATTSCGAL
jgi:hypothetical protein